MTMIKRLVVAASGLGVVFPTILSVGTLSGCASEPCTQYDYRTVYEQVCARRTNTGHCAHYTSRTRTKKVCVARAGVPIEPKQETLAGREYRIKKTKEWEEFVTEARQLAKQQAHTPTGWMNGVWARNCLPRPDWSIRAEKLVDKNHIQIALPETGKLGKGNKITWSGNTFKIQRGDVTDYRRKISDRHWQAYAEVTADGKRTEHEPIDYYKCEKLDKNI